MTYEFLLYMVPLWHVHVNLAGPLKTVVQQSACAHAQAQVLEVKAWIVVAVDYFTKVPKFLPVFSKKQRKLLWHSIVAGCVAMGHQVTS